MIEISIPCYLNRIRFTFLQNDYIIAKTQYLTLIDLSNSYKTSLVIELIGYYNNNNNGWLIIHSNRDNCFGIFLFLYICIFVL